MAAIQFSCPHFAYTGRMSSVGPHTSAHLGFSVGGLDGVESHLRPAHEKTRMQDAIARLCKTIVAPVPLRPLNPPIPRSRSRTTQMDFESGGSQWGSISSI